MPTPTLDAHPELANVAKICHAVNRAWVGYATGEIPDGWDEADDHTKESVAQGILFLTTHPDATDEAMHNNWLAYKEADGWIYGPTKDPEAKTHPAFLPYEALPRWQRFKDALFTTIVRAALT